MSTPPTSMGWIIWRCNAPPVIVVASIRTGGFGWVGTVDVVTTNGSLALPSPRVELIQDTIAFPTEAMTRDWLK